MPIRHTVWPWLTPPTEMRSVRRWRASSATIRDLVKPNNENQKMKLKKKLIRQAGLLLFLPVSIALYFGTASLRAEQALKHASLADLQFQAQQDPNDARIAYYLGLRAQALHKDELALDSFTSAATLA